MAIYLGRMKPAFVNSSSCFFNSTNSVALRRNVGREGGTEPGIIQYDDPLHAEEEDQVERPQGTHHEIRREDTTTNSFISCGFMAIRGRAVGFIALRLKHLNY